MDALKTPTRTEERWNKLKEFLDVGPPKEPTLEEPGSFQKALGEMIEEVERSGVKMSPEDRVYLLAHMIDVFHWKEYMAKYNDIKREYDQAMLRRSIGTLSVP